MARDRRRGNHVARPMRPEPAAAPTGGSTAVSPAAPTRLYPSKSKSAAPDPSTLAVAVTALAGALSAAIPAAANASDESEPTPVRRPISNPQTPNPANVAPIAYGFLCVVLKRFPPPRPSCYHPSNIVPSGMKECASGNAIAVHRNVRSDALLMYTGTELSTSGTNVFGFGFGRGSLTLIVRYDTRVRKATQTQESMRNGCIHLQLTNVIVLAGARGRQLRLHHQAGPGRSHRNWRTLLLGGCQDRHHAGLWTRKLGTPTPLPLFENTLCSPTRVFSRAQIDIIPEDWRLLASGKKRLKWDVACGDIPLCSDPSMPPPLPTTPPPPPFVVHSPSPPPFPPGTIMPPRPPMMPAPPTLPPRTGILSDDGWLLPVSAATLAVVGLAGAFVFTMRRGAQGKVSAIAPDLVPVAVVRGVVPGKMLGRDVGAASDNVPLLWG
jgi:hypothetical protein